MENTKKWLTLTFLLFSIIAWYLSSALIKGLSTYFMLVEKYSWAPAMIIIVPPIIGIVVYYLCYKIQTVHNYMLEVVNEVNKVTWPGKKETWAATIVVIIAVIISGILLGFFDWASSHLLRYILR